MLKQAQLFYFSKVILAFFAKGVYSIGYYIIMTGCCCHKMAKKERVNLGTDFFSWRIYMYPINSSA